MATKSEAAKARWAKVDSATRSVIMRERKRKGDKGRTPEARKAHAIKAVTARWKRGGDNVGIIA